MSSRRIIQNATLVTPDGLQRDSHLLIDRGRIAALGANGSYVDGYPGDTEVLDARGAYVLPGLIDLHTDTLEKEITPRPAADFPIAIAVHELDRKLVACGITTVYHSLHFGYQEAEWSSRSKYTRREVVDGVRALAGQHSLARTRIHARFEIVGDGPKTRDLVCALLDEGAVDLLSFMDHTPGQGQYTRERFVSQRMREGRSEAEALAVLEEKQRRPRLSLADMRSVAQLAISLGVPVASHDDDTPEKVRQMHDLGVSVCEFPVTMTAAQTARELGQHVLGGSSNVLRGGSLTGNLNVTEAIRMGVMDGLCSDYYPPSMLHAVFKLARENVLPLHRAVATASLIPAEAAGIADETGSLMVGKEADLVVVRLRGDHPVVTHTFVRGELVHFAGREVVTQEAVV
jgi:alpha-D-ribose 1-methylphosphonate 5-triphosphate diphosphatase